MSGDNPNVITLKDQLKDCSQQLLDFSKRNPYLNFRIKSAVEFDAESWGYLVHRVSVRKNAFKVEKPKIEKSSLQNSIVSCGLGFDGSSRNRAIPLCNVDDYKDKFQFLYNKSRLAQSEKGVNVIFLCLGLLHYSDNGPLKLFEGSKKTDFYAPLLIQPVSLSRESLDGPYTVEPDSNEELSTNLTLEDFFKRTLQFSLPAFNGMLMNPVDEYLSKMQQIADKNGWTIERRAFIQCLQYQRLAIYNDITKNESDIQKSSLIDMLFGNESELSIPTIETDESTTLDQKVTPATNFDVLDADASQDAAVRYAMEGKSLILQGPPGTGKSQTITNIIANAMAKGKKVLFVAQKREALDVVYRNLGRCSFDVVSNNDAGSTGTLADFCLYLHDTRTKKKDVMLMLRTAMDYEHKQVDMSRRHDLNSLVQIRNELTETDFALHQPILPLNKSVFECYGFVMKCEDGKHYQFDLPDFLTYTYDHVKSIGFAIATFAKTCGDFSDDIRLKNPWYRYQCHDIAFTFPPDSLLSIKTCFDVAQHFSNVFIETARILSLPNAKSGVTLENSNRYCHTIDVLCDKKNITFQIFSNPDLAYLRGLIKTAGTLAATAKAEFEIFQSLFNDTLPLLKFLRIDDTIPSFGKDASPLSCQISKAFEAFPTIFTLVSRNRDDIKISENFKDYHLALSSRDSLYTKLNQEFKEGVFFFRC